MDHASAQLLRAIRGHRSQMAHARRVGVSVATVAAWENARRCPSITTVLEVSRRAGRDPDAAFAQFHRAAWTGDGVAAWLRAVQAGRRRAALVEATGFSVHQIGRWMTGRAQPRLSEFLALVQAMTGRVEDLVALWVPIEQVPALHSAWSTRDRARRLAWEEPWSEAILQMVRSPVETRDIARRLGVDGHTVKRVLHEMEQVGLVARRGDRFVPGPAQTVDTGTDPDRVRVVKQHWAAVAAASAGNDEGLCAYNVFSCSAQDAAIVREELVDAFRRVRARIASSHSNEAVGLLLVQLVPFDAATTDPHTQR